jgi:hypothetical protein
MQSAERRDPLRTRPQHQVIGVRQHDVGAAGAHGLRRQPLDRGLGADRHERRRRHRPVRRRHFAAAGGAIGG